MIVILIGCAALAAYYFVWARSLPAQAGRPTPSQNNTQQAARGVTNNEDIQNSTSSAEEILIQKVQKQPTLSVGSTVLNLEIADTVDERTLGLSNRKSLPQDTGLLFVFEESGDWGFWMKDMNFAIDMIWLDENFNVVGLKKNATPGSYPQVFKSGMSAKYVLETNVGFAEQYNIEVGTQLKRPDTI
ncbi:MAG: DUF192 domain-containing protein [bacterium]|nr:DUF192 domain-containing protein [bacterium]